MTTKKEQTPNMKVASEISPQFIDGFVGQCIAMGMGPDETEILFRKHANNKVIARPNIYDGFREAIANYEGPLRKSAMTRWMNPDMIAMAEEVRLNFGEDPLSCQMREAMGLPEPSWDNVPDNVKAAATNLSHIIDQFDYLPLNQKVLLAMIAGGGLGGAARGLAPTDEDEALGRTSFNRVTRGALRGAGAGAGAAAGASAGSDIAGRFAPDMRLPGMLLGGTIGGMAGKRLTSDVIS